MKENNIDKNYNKKVVGKFKDEYAKSIITKICAIRSKMYCV
jgi:hypothetical protein